MSTVLASPPGPQTLTVVPRAPQQFVGPLVTVLAVAAFWALTLRNTVFIDEAVYVMAGQAYIEHWLTGEPLAADVGAGFSGAPVLYPVLAAVLDMIGGLELLRFFSLACIIGTALLLRSLATNLFSARAGLLTAAMFSLTGPVIYIAHLGTFDAPVVLLLALALWLGLTRTSMRSALLMGAILALAVVTKYTAYVFVPPILIMALYSPSPARVIDYHRLVRSLGAFLVTCTIVGLAYLAGGPAMEESVRFTTTGRAALSPASPWYLLLQVPDHIWLIGACAAVGLVWAITTRQRNLVLLGLAFIGTAALLPLAQMRLGEAVSFEKHLAYSSLFLAPLAGWGLARPWRLAIYTPVLIWLLVLSGIWAAFRSQDLIQYPNVSPVVNVLGNEPTPGRYLSESASVLSYYTQRDPTVDWDATSDLFVSSKEDIERVVREQTYLKIILMERPTGSTLQDVGQDSMITALEASNAYNRTTIQEGTLVWLVYTLEV